MKRFFLFVFAAITAAGMWACPAMPGAFRHVKMVDGTTVKAFIHGDEFFNYETDENEFLLTPNDKGLYVNTRRRISAEEVQQRRAAARRAAGVTDEPRRIVGHPMTPPRTLVVLVQYQDVKFRPENTKSEWEDFFSKEGYDYKGSPGSVRDYFIAQSGGKYKPEFDVVGPVTLANNQAYYGYNKHGIEAYEAVKEACALLDDEVDFSQYDSDGDGDIDFVFMLYAGEGAANGSDDAIWPHHSGWRHSWYSKEGKEEECLKLDGKYFTMYACSNEWHVSAGRREGIGTACHEMSHNLGLPDYYDSKKVGTTRLPKDWNLMGSGNWNNGGITPCNWSIYDKYYLGWETPYHLSKDGITYVLKPSSEGWWITKSGKLSGATDTETVYYLENRQKQGWDKYLPGHGLVIWKVNYDQDAWEGNRPNSTLGEEERMTFVSSANIVGDNEPFPGRYGGTSVTLGVDAITNIEEDAEGNISFKKNDHSGGVDLQLELFYNKSKYDDDELNISDDRKNKPLDFRIKLPYNDNWKCELQYARHRLGSQEAFSTITTEMVEKDAEMWFTTGNELWFEEKITEIYDHTDYVLYRMKITHDSKEYYTNTVQVNFVYTLWLDGTTTWEKAGKHISLEIGDCFDLSFVCTEPIDFHKENGKLEFTMPACRVYINTEEYKNFNVYFYDWDGTKISSSLVGCGSDAVAPTPPNHPGFVFTGWDRDFTNVHSDLKVYATYARPEGRDTYEMELAEHLCENYPYADTYTVQNKNYKFEGSSTRAMVKDKLTFRLKHTATDAGTVYFWWTADFDEDGEPIWHTGTKVAELTTQEALADKEVLYSYWVCNNPQAYSDEKTNAEKIAFKFRYVDKNLPLSFETKPMVFDIYYPQFLKFKHSDRLLAAVSSGDNRYTLKLPSDGEQVGDYVYGMVPARYTDTVFLYGTDAYNTDDCLEFQRLRNKSWTYVNTDVTADGTVCYVPEGFIDTIQITKTVYPVHFTYRKSDGEGGYYSYEDVQYIPCGSSAVMPSLSEIEYDPVHHPFTEWLCENKPDDRRWMNVREELYYGAYYDYIPHPGQYTVTFVSWEDQLLTEQTVAKFEDAVPPTPPTREGYHFIRWDGDYTFVTEDRRIRAVYGQDDVYWTVSFYNDGWYSDLLGTEQVADGEKAVGNMEVYMDDHVFIGWDKPLDEVHSDLNVAAQYEWREMEHHKVTIVAEHGTVTIRPRQVNPDFVNHGTVLFLEAVPDEGYKLLGWEGYSVQFGITITDDTTVTALFCKDQPTAIEDATQSSSSPQVQKIFRNGHIYILRGTRIFTLQGQEVK